METVYTTGTVVVVLNNRQNPTGKLASAEIVFSGGVLEGMRLVGFGIWKKSAGGNNVTFPSRQYLQDGQLRTFTLLKPLRDDGSNDRLRQAILAEYARLTAPRRPELPQEEFPDLPRP